MGYLEKVLEEYTYNVLNQLQNYKNNITGKSASYSYYVDGLRKSKTVDGLTTNYYNDGSNVIIETDGSNNLTARNIIGLKNIGRQENSGNINYFLYNGHGDITQVVNGEGKTLNNYEYDIYGKEKETKEQIKNPIRYGGQYYDEESSLYYLRARYYSPDLMRFMSEDTYRGDISNPGSLNYYAYCCNDPVNRIDPSGFDSFILYDSGAVSGDGKHTFKDEAYIRKKQLEEEYGTTVWVLSVADAMKFKDIWNSRVGYDSSGNAVSIDEVVLIFHGSIGDSTESGENGIGYMTIGKSKVAASSNLFSFNSDTDISISDLDSKKMAYLYFSSCNSGNPDVMNTASAFKQCMNVTRCITAWDGGTIFNYSTGQLEAGAYGGWMKEMKRQSTYYKYVAKTWYGKPKRMRQGMINFFMGDTYDFNYRC